MEIKASYFSFFTWFHNLLLKASNDALSALLAMSHNNCNLQVLRVYHDRRQKRFTRLGGDSYATADEFDPLKNTSSSSSRKRKRSLEGKSSKHAKSEAMGGDLCKQRLAQVYATNDRLSERQNCFLNSLGDHESHSLQDHIDDHMQAVEEQESNEEDEHDDFVIHKCALSKLKSGRTRKFSWTEEADR